MQALSKLCWPVDGWGILSPLVDFPVAMAECAFLFYPFNLTQSIFIYALHPAFLSQSACALCLQ